MGFLDRWAGRRKHRSSATRRLASLQLERCGSDMLERRLPLTASISSIASHIAAATASKPGSPTNVEATPGNNIVSLRWTPPASNGGSAIFDYQIKYTISGDGGKSWSTPAVYDDGVSGKPEATVSPVVPWQYKFQVAARNSVGVGPLSGWTLAVTPFRAPSRLSISNATAGDGVVTLNWAAPTSDGGKPITDYLIQYKTPTSPWTTFNDGVSTDTTATVTGLTNGTAYSFQVAAVNSAGAGEYSVSVIRTPAIPVAAPSAPTSVIGTPGDGVVNLTWNKPASGTDITNYEIQYSIEGAGNWKRFVRPTSAGTSATVTGLTNGARYVFQVAAINAGGTSAFSDVSSPVMPVAPQPTSEQWVNNTTNYVFAIWRGMANGAVIGTPVVLGPGKSAYPEAYKPGTSKTLYIAYARNVNLPSNWYTLVTPNQRVTIPDAQRITFSVTGVTSVYVNGKLATVFSP